MPRQRSFIWDYFTKHENGAAVCDHCHRKIVVNSGSTSNLIKHMRAKHKDVLPESISIKGDMDLKEEYILLQGEPSENYDEFIQEEQNKIEISETQYEEMLPPQAKKIKHSHLDEEYHMKPMYLPEPIRRPVKSNIREAKEKEDGPLDIFAKYMTSLMQDMPRKLCEQTQLKIVSVILEAKNDESAAVESTVTCTNGE